MNTNEIETANRITKAAAAGYVQSLINRGVHPEVALQKAAAYANPENGTITKTAAKRLVVAQTILGALMGN